MGAFKSLIEVLEEGKKLKRGYDDHGKPIAFTDKEFFDISTMMGLNQDNPDYCQVHKNLAAWIQNTLRPKSALEYGCGPGYLLNCLNELKIDAIGVDGNPFSQEFFVKKHPDFREKYVLDKFFDCAYSPKDVLITIECFEHIPDMGLEKIMDKVVKVIKPKFIVFSSTPYKDPNEGWDIQWGHINIKQPNEWRSFFEKYGFELTDLIPPCTPWASVYKLKVDTKKVFVYL